MKSIKRIITGVFFIFAFSALSAQTPPPPNNGNGTPSGGNTPVGGGAPIGTGLAILVALGVGYGGKKVYEIKKRKLVE